MLTTLVFATCISFAKTGVHRARPGTPSTGICREAPGTEYDRLQCADQDGVHHPAEPAQMHMHHKLCMQVSFRAAVASPFFHLSRRGDYHSVAHLLLRAGTDCLFIGLPREVETEHFVRSRTSGIRATGTG